MSEARGILYVDGAWVFNSPLSFHHNSSEVNHPIPCIKAPSICPLSKIGFSERPTSCKISVLSMRYSPVKVSIDTSVHAAPYA